MKLLKLQLGDAATGRTLTPPQAVRRWIGYGEFVQLLGFIPALAVRGQHRLVPVDDRPADHDGHEPDQARAFTTGSRARPWSSPTGSGNTAVILGCLLIVALVVICRIRRPSSSSVRR